MRSSTQARTIQRQGPRVVPPSLKIAVVRRNLIAPNEHEFCELLDVSHSGIGISSQWLDGKIGQKLDLEFFHDRKTFTARGIITRVTAFEKFDQYGVAFIYAPPDLDFLIDLFIREHPPAQGELPVTTEPLKKPQRASRHALLDAQIYVKKLASSAPATVCQVDNISQGGMGFYCPVQIDRQAPFTVSVQISEPPGAMLITGTVHYLSKKGDAYYYGMEYELVPMEFVRLLGKLEQLDHGA
jgi:hypothetical protein